MIRSGAKDTVRHSHALRSSEGWDRFRRSDGTVPGFRRVRQTRVLLCDPSRRHDDDRFYHRDSAGVESVKSGLYSVSCPGCLAILARQVAS